MNRRYVVRIVTMGIGAFDQQVEHGPLLECLRYAHVIHLHRHNEKGTCFDILPPSSISASDTKMWAENNAARMRGFGANAVAAPEWKE